MSFKETDSFNMAEEKHHDKLVENILNLNSRQYVKKPTRTEPTAEISEFNLVKSLTKGKDTLSLYDLTKSLKDRAAHVELRKKVKKSEVKSKTLPKPLEKPQAERIKRSVGYENTKKKLDRWEPLVTSNRVSTNLTFPLKDPNHDYKEARDFTSNWVLKSNLEKALEKIETKSITYEVETDNNIGKIDEMIAKRKECQKYRRYQSNKEMKARWKNKIKSKNFRRIARKEKNKELMNEFQTLQATNPEEALKKLEEIEKARAEERASLRHKSTGKWARNLQIRAKYNKESRKELAEQLVISKNLMKKEELDETSDSEPDKESNDVTEIQNSNTICVSKEVQEFYGGYKKFAKNCSDIKNNEEIKNENNKSIQQDNNIWNVYNSISEEGDNIDNKKLENCEDLRNLASSTSENKIASKQKRKINVNTQEISDAFIQPKRRKYEAVEIEVDTAAGDWQVTSLNDIVKDDNECKIKKKINKKIRYKENSDVTAVKIDKLKSASIKTKNTKRESTNIKTRGTVKEENSNEEAPIVNKNATNIEVINNSRIKSDNLAELAYLKSLIETAETIKFNSTDSSKEILSAHESEDVSKSEKVTENLLITQEHLFEDDELTKEFMKEKNEEIEKDTPTDIDLSLPGWGCWGGKDLSIPTRKKKRFLLKVPKNMPRKDMNQGNLIINESGNDTIRSHLVSNVPFPFKTVKDFEASIRAPIGNTFVPETAYRRMIKPAIRTRIGAVIEPITEDVLLKTKKKK